MKEITSTLKIEMFSSGASLAEAIELTQNNILPETSTSIFLEGDIVRVRRSESGRSFRFCQQDGKPFIDYEIFAELDTDDIDEEAPNSMGKKIRAARRIDLD